VGDELEKLASKGRDRQERLRDRSRKSADQQKIRDEKSERARAIESLDRWARVRRLVITLGFFGGIIAVARTHGDPRPSGLYALVLFLGALATFALALFLAEKAASLFAASELRALRDLPFQFDAEKYRAALGKKRAVCSPTLTVTFADTVADDDRDLMADAVTGAVSKAKASWSGSSLRIESEPIDTVFRAVRTRGGAGKSYNSNHKVHNWVRTIMRKAIVPMHQRAPIETVSVHLSR
jgi:hypothetical protein